MLETFQGGNSGGGSAGAPAFGGDGQNHEQQALIVCLILTRCEKDSSLGARG